MSRIFDVFAVAAVAVVFLLPKASVNASPALMAEKVELDQIAELEDAHHADPASVEKAVALADAYLALLHPDWALASTAAYVALNNWRVHLVRTTAFAERLEAQACVDEAKLGSAACDKDPTCNDAVRTKLTMISSGMKALVEQGIDPRKDPRKAREAVAKMLHTTKANKISPPDKK
jgi:hypothetical protein